MNHCKSHNRDHHLKQLKRLEQNTHPHSAWSKLDQTRKSSTRKGKQGRSYNLPVNVLTWLSLIFDCSKQMCKLNCLFVLEWWSIKIFNKKKNKHLKSRIKICLSFMAPSVMGMKAYCIGPRRSTTEEERSLIVLTALTIFLALRCPLTAVITYASNHK